MYEHPILELFGHRVLKKLNKMIQHHKGDKYASQCELNIIESTKEYIRFEYNYGYWYHCVSVYDFIIGTEKFRPISFSQSSVTGCGGSNHQDFDSSLNELNIDQVYDEIIQRFE